MKTIDLKIHECWKVKSAKMPQQPGGSLPEVGASLSLMVETVEDVSVSRNGVYKIYDHMHVAFLRIIPRIIPANHTTNHTLDFEAMF